jgi:TPP-dependent pyruvate/acetoin dehydrogenase alpha subunit
MNVLEVRESVAAACERARKAVPSLVEALVYRCPSPGRNQAKYQAELDAWKAKDPIRLFRTRLNEAEVLSTAHSGKIEQEVTREVEAAAKWALKESPPSAPGEVVSDVYKGWVEGPLGLARSE